jgi:hypothetical protein
VIRWEVSADKFDRLLQLCAETVSAKFDEWDRDAIAYGLQDPAPVYEYGIHGETSIQLRLARTPGGGLVEAEAEPPVESELAKIALLSDAELLAAIYAAFGDAPRPRWFTNHPGCPECEGHDALMQARDWDTLTHHDVRPNWSPVGFLIPEGFRYWLPAFMRLSLLDGPEDEACFPGVLYDYLGDPDAVDSWRLNRAERRAVAMFLRHLGWWHPELTGDGHWRREFDALRDAWSRGADAVK